LVAATSSALFGPVDTTTSNGAVERGRSESRLLGPKTHGDPLAEFGRTFRCAGLDCSRDVSREHVVCFQSRETPSTVTTTRRVVTTALHRANRRRECVTGARYDPHRPIELAVQCREQRVRWICLHVSLLCDEPTPRLLASWRRSRDDRGHRRRRGHGGVGSA